MWDEISLQFFYARLNMDFSTCLNVKKIIIITFIGK